MSSILRVISCFLCIFPCNLVALNIDISAAHWQEVAEPGGNGIYLKLITEIYAEANLTFDLSNYARAKRLFNQNKSDILVGVYKDEASALTQSLFSKFHIDVDDPIVAIYNPQVNQIRQKQDLQHKTIGWLEEYSFDIYVPDNITKYPVKDLTTAYYLLEKGRVDAIIDYEHNLPKKERAIFKALTLTHKKHLYLAFKNTDKGQQLRKIFEDKLLALKSSGRLKQLYGKRYEKANFSKAFEH